jgi:epoxyqueuosine reductase QueG
VITPATYADKRDRRDPMTKQEHETELDWPDEFDIQQRGQSKRRFIFRKQWVINDVVNGVNAVGRISVNAQVCQTRRQEDP